MPHVTHNGKMSYRRTDEAWFIWWDVAGAWKITILLGIPIDDWWTRIDPNIEGEYVPSGTATGTATVTEI